MLCLIIYGTKRKSNYKEVQEPELPHLNFFGDVEATLNLLFNISRNTLSYFISFFLSSSLRFSL